jgi:hypothetical protein
MAEMIVKPKNVRVVFWILGIFACVDTCSGRTDFPWMPQGIGGSYRHYWDCFDGVLLLDVWQRHCSSGHNVHYVGSAEGQYSCR